MDFRPWMKQLSDAQRAAAQKRLRELVIRAQHAAAPIAKQGDVELTMYKDRPDMEAFAAIMGVEGEIPREPGSWLAYTSSKPAMEGQVSHIHALEAVEDEPIPTIYVKARRQQTLAKAWNTEATGPGETAALAHAPLLEWAQKEAGRQGAPFRIEGDLEQTNGPDFMCEPPTTEGDVVHMPVLTTDVDLMEPFGGHFYFKLLHPEAALAWALFS